MALHIDVPSEERVGSPCTRRDGPFFTHQKRRSFTFSLHAQGWPYTRQRPSVPAAVLPARAGMARCKPDCGLPFDSSPCTRRDGPPDYDDAPCVLLFSLHAQGWPVLFVLPDIRWAVLPARAGMARCRCSRSISAISSPCTRRDGPFYRLGIGMSCLFSLHAQGWPDGGGSSK